MTGAAVFVRAPIVEQRLRRYWKFTDCLLHCSPGFVTMLSELP